MALLELSPVDFASPVEFDELDAKPEALRGLCQTIYRGFDDAFDFVFIELRAKKPDWVDYWGSAKGVSKAVRGIGQQIWNGSELYGSAGRLKTVIWIPDSRGIWGGLGLHEVAHTWGNRILKVGFHETTSGASARQSGHWGFTGGSDQRRQGGFKQADLQELPDGSFRVPTFGQYVNLGGGGYSDLELCQMGLIPPEAIAPFGVFRGITNCERKDGWVHFQATERIRSDGAKLVREAGGQRVPSPKESQEHFRGLLLQEWDRPYETEGIERTVGDKQAAWFEKAGSDGDPGVFNFWEGTRGLATIQPSGLKIAVKPGAKVTTDVK